jgi:autoinducer 2-degrading protein
MKFAVMVVFKVLNSEVTVFERELRLHAENTWKETGALKFIIYVDELDPSIFYLYELYENRKEFEKHTQTDYIEIFKNKVTPLMREPAQIFRGVPLISNPKSDKGEI